MSIKADKWFVLDVETYGNAFLVAVKEIGVEAYHGIWLHDPDAKENLRRLVSGNRGFITFNGLNYDIPMVWAAIDERFDEAALMKLSDEIITNDMRSWETSRKFGIKEVPVIHVDLLEVAPSFVGLKSYGARMNIKHLRELPYPVGATLTEDMMREVQEYCYNDLKITEALLRELKQPLRIREDMGEQYGLDLMSKSDGQMAEAAFKRKFNVGRVDVKIPDTIGYVAPSFLQFNDEQMKEVFNRAQQHRFEVNKSTGHVILPEFLKQPLKLYDGVFQLGVGGLHSKHDKSVCYLAGENYLITDMDAASYYPSIMLLTGLFPPAYGPRFLTEYRRMFDTRIAAKRSGDKKTADTLRIALNSVFGKLASRYSSLYAVDMMLAVTLTGQFTLLMLIERLHGAGADILSSNTDGIVIGYPSYLDNEIKATVSQFEQDTGFEMEYNPYKTLAMKDVNNYFAISTNRKIKAKGLYAPPDLRKNPTAPVCARAFENWLMAGTPFEETINAAPMTDFVSARSVTGGGMHNGQYLGKVVRWYQSTASSEPLTYRSSGNKVPKTDGAMPCMILPDEIPEDLDKLWYVKETCMIARDLGCEQFLSEEHKLLIKKPEKKTRSKKNG